MTALRRTYSLPGGGFLGAFVCLLTLLPTQSAAGSVDEFQSLLEQGFALHNHADYQHSIPLLTRAWKLSRHDYFANLLLGIDLLRTGKAEDAISYLKEASRQRPREDFPYDYLAEAQAVRGDYAGAAVAHAKAIEVASDPSQALESSADFWVERFRQISAHLRGTDRGLAAEYRLQALSPSVTRTKREELLERAVSLDPKAPGIWSDLALADISASNLSEARANIGRGLELNPEDLGAKKAEAVLAAYDGNWSASIADLNEIGRRSPLTLERGLVEWPQALQIPRDLVASGEAGAFLKCAAEQQRKCPAIFVGHVVSSRIGAAKVSSEKLFQEQRWESIAALPAPPVADGTRWLERGIALAQLNHCEIAIPALERSLALQRDEVYARFLLCGCYAREADRVLGALQRSKGDEAIGHIVRGDVLLRMQGNSAAAIAEYGSALQAHGDDPKVLERLAEAQFENGKFDAATKNAQAALRIDPFRFSAMETLARVAMEQRNYPAALPYLEKLAQHQPTEAKAQVDLGVALAESGNASEALLYLEAPLRQGYADEKGSLHALLGSALRKLGRAEEAAQAFSEARRLSDEYQRSSHRGGNDQKHQSKD
jgi:tetratricopeptide (TPR) repeat protein